MRSNKKIQELLREENAIPKFEGGTPPSEIIEGVATGVLEELYHTTHASAEIALGMTESKLTPLKSFRALSAIFTAEIRHLKELLDTCSSKTLNPKHRILKMWLELADKRAELMFETADDAVKNDRNENDPDIMDACRDSLRILQDFRDIMHEQTSQEDRRLCYLAAKEDWTPLPEECN